VTQVLFGSAFAGLVAGFLLCFLFEFHRYLIRTAAFYGLVYGLSWLVWYSYRGSVEPISTTLKLVVESSSGPVLPISTSGFVIGLIGALAVFLFATDTDELNKEDDSIPLGDQLFNWVRNLNKRRSESTDAIRLGDDQDTRKLVEVPLSEWRKGAAIFGQTGSGKTNTLSKISEEVISKNLPLVYIDAKPDRDIEEFLIRMAEKHDRPFKKFDPTDQNSYSYNPLRHGTIHSRTDKLVDLFEFSGEARVYKNRAQNYLTEVIRSMTLAGETPQLQRVFELSRDTDELIEYVSEEVPEGQQEEQQKRIESLSVTGSKSQFATELGTIARSEWSDLLIDEDSGIDLVDSLNEKGGPVTLFVLPGLSHGSSIQRLGQVIINDLASVMEQMESDLKRFVLMDEYHKIASEKTADILAMGRSFNICSVLSSQEPTDVKGSGDDDLLNRVLGNTNIRICHKLKNPESRERMADEIGTEEVEKTTRQVDLESGDELMGSVRDAEQYRVHPKLFSKLHTGEVYLWHGDMASYYKIKIDYIS
jgi:type IV secretory pathway TraG/TraD family ATPase VirD4